MEIAVCKCHRHDVFGSGRTELLKQIKVVNLVSQIQIQLVVTKSSAHVPFSVSSSESFSFHSTSNKVSFLCGWQKV